MIIRVSLWLTSSERAAVNGNSLERRQVDILQAAHVDGRRFDAGRVLAEREGRAAAFRAELMLDEVLVECVGAQRVGAGHERELRARNEPEQVALAAAMRAVALHCLLKVAIHFE